MAAKRRKKPSAASRNQRILTGARRGRREANAECKTQNAEFPIREIREIRGLIPFRISPWRSAKLRKEKRADG
jgi:hypothetical protein